MWSNKGITNRSAESHYSTMPKEDIQNLPIKNICNKNSVLFLWVTIPCLIEGLELINKWGFKYKTVAFVWVKKNKKSDNLFWGMGYYTRANVELCLLATMGKGLTRINKNIHQVIYSPVREHSRKPDETRDRIVRLFGNVKKLNSSHVKVLITGIHVVMK